MVGSTLAHSVADAFDRLLRPAAHPVLTLLADAPLAADDVLAHVEATADEGADWSALATGIDRLLRPGAHPVMRLLAEGPLTVADILAVRPADADEPDAA